ncbi:hypothetical protein [Bacillus thuringiensis]|uniref:hypothetical protein n=1 Tax=Bacillus thuringiensis TaxID=1428 RepID=UPI002D8040AA|nr:hypothetical protein [Bacillus thuringiensis]MEB4818883.1 hypothetical protein [Bacillus thuringiensis]
MDNINSGSVLERAFYKFNKTQVIQYIKGKRDGWVQDKKDKNKVDLRDAFLALESILSEQDIIDLTEMTVMKRKKGLSAYTYRFKDLGKLKDKTLEQLQKEYVKSYVINPMYEVVLSDINIEGHKITLSLKVKEYETFWKTNVQDLGSLTALYLNKVIFETDINKISIEAGDDNIEEVIEIFLANRLSIPLIPYTIKIFDGNNFGEDSATKKTMLIFDYIYNRLSSREISSNFNDVKFRMNDASRSGGVKSVTVNGTDIITSDEACKYITLGNDIISFKTTSIYQGSKVNVQFSLKGKEFDKLKVVILNNKSEIFKQELMRIMQEEYILMCEEGIKDISATRRRLEPIYEFFITSRS